MLDDNCFGKSVKTIPYFAFLHQPLQSLRKFWCHRFKNGDELYSLYLMRTTVGSKKAR